MDNQNTQSAADNRTAKRKLDYRLLMKFLANGDMQSAELYCRRYQTVPDLSEVLVRSGRLSQEEFDDLIKVHNTLALRDIPFGTFFLYSGCLSADELRNFLLLRKTLRARVDSAERWGQKLIRSGLLTITQLRLALEDKALSQCTLRQAILDRGWLNESDLDRIF